MVCPTRSPHWAPTAVRAVESAPCQAQWPPHRTGATMGRWPTVPGASHLLASGEAGPYGHRGGGGANPSGQVPYQRPPLCVGGSCATPVVLTPAVPTPLAPPPSRAPSPGPVPTPPFLAPCLLVAPCFGCVRCWCLTPGAAFPPSLVCARVGGHGVGAGTCFPLPAL